MIDELCRKGGVPLGTAYCALGASILVVDAACKELGYKNPLGITASSQSCANRAPKKYWRPAGEAAQKGDLHVETRYDDSSLGHVGTVERMIDGTYYWCVDFNSNAAGDHDGEGVDRVKRSIKGDSAKKHKCFVNVAEWILDFNGIV